MSHAIEADKLLIRPEHGVRAGTGGRSGQVPFKATRKRQSVFGSRCRRQTPASGTKPTTGRPILTISALGTTPHQPCNLLTSLPWHDLGLELQARGVSDAHGRRLGDQPVLPDEPIYPH